MYEFTKTSMGQSRKYPWQDIEAAYVYDSGESLRGLARRFNVKYSKIQARAKAEGWSRKRREFQADVASRVVGALAQKIISALTQAIDRMGAISQSIYRRISEELHGDSTVVEEITTVTRRTADGSIVKTTRTAKRILDSRATAKLLAANNQFLIGLYELVLRHDRGGGGTRGCPGATGSSSSPERWPAGEADEEVTVGERPLSHRREQ